MLHARKKYEKKANGKYFFLKLIGDLFMATFIITGLAIYFSCVAIKNKLFKKKTNI